MTKLRDMFEGFILKMALKKGAKAFVGVLGSTAALQQAGVSVDVTKLETWLIATASSLVTMGLNWAKVKTKIGAKLL